MASEYGVHIGTYAAGRKVRRDEIAAGLDASNTDHAKLIAAMDRLNRNGMRYSNEDSHVFGAAFRAACRNGAHFSASA